MINFSAWNSLPPKQKKKNPAFSPSHLIIEFQRTKRAKIFAHRLGRVDFKRDKDVNAARQGVIDIEVGNVTPKGFRYANIGHVYSGSVVIPPEADDSYPVYAHGYPLGGTEYAGMESCSREGLYCSEGNGADGFCKPGKCVIGRLSRVSSNKWKYESVNTYGAGATPLVYFVSGKEESVELKSVLRGRVYSGSKLISIDKPASKKTTVYLPPKYYYSDDFLESLIVQKDLRLGEVFKSPSSFVVGVSTRKEMFAKSIALLAYPNTTEGVISKKLNSPAPEEVKNALEKFFDQLPDAWKAQVDSVISAEFNITVSGLDFILRVYDKLLEMFSCVIQESKSSFSSPKISYDKETIARPVYSRLPGISESYRSDPAFSDTETPAQWLTSGADEFLSKKKEDISNFYESYLDPETCSSAVLDWLAQHVGLAGPLWDERWDRPIKEALIKNSFGWWDREIVDEFGNLTPKGVVVHSYPFTTKEWFSDDINYAWGNKEKNWGEALSSWGGDKYSLNRLKLDEIGKIEVSADSTQLSRNTPIKYKGFDESSTTALVLSTDSVKINKALWNGIIEAKGSLLVVMFFVSLFGLKSHSPEELEVVDLERGLFKPRSGLRSAEISAPPLLPYKPDVLQVGTVEDAKINNYQNQLIAGVSRVSSLDHSKNVFFRVPYYYNRDGKSWDRVEYIAKNWLPSNLNVRVQYPYLSAGLWAVGDAFFQPEVV